MCRPAPLLLALLLAAAAGRAGAQCPQVGTPSPGFTLQANDAMPFSSAALAGRVAVITYETKDVIEMNKAFKARVRELCADPDVAREVAIVAVVSCFQYVWPVRGLCVSRVQQSARKLGMPLYVDDDGRMGADFCMQADTSNVLVVDRQGIVRFKKAGQLSRDEIREAIGLIRRPE